MKLTLRTVFGFAFMILLSTSFAQKDYSINMKKASSEIKLDGEFDEQAWQDAEMISDFYNSKPVDTSYAISITEVRLTYNDNFLYIAATCYDELPGDYIVQSLKRDFSFPRTDAFGVFIDPYLDGTNGFSFACNPYGAQREGVLEYGGIYGVTTAWDNKWYSETKISEGKWTVEMAIPFKTLRFKEGMDEWKINFARHDQKRNEESTWVPVPVNFNVAHLGYTGSLKWDEPTRSPGKNISLIPYVSSGAFNNFDGEGTDVEPKAGFDAKVGITSSLNLDITVNPDFSQVEVDRQVTNLDRFEPSFPEQRQFFIENNDLFGNLGSRLARPFFSRRVGIATYSDPESGQTRTAITPILGGVRLSGKVNNNWRVGVLNIQTNKDEDLGIDGQNYAMAITQHKFWKRSNVSAFMVNRQGFGSDSTQPDAFNSNDYNRVVGADISLLSANGQLNAKSYVHRSISPDESDPDAFSIGNSFEYDTKKIYAGVFQEFVGEDYSSEVGFTPRTGYYHYKPEVGYFIYPKASNVFNYHLFGGIYDHYTSTDHTTQEQKSEAYYEVRFMNTAKVKFSGINSKITLQRNFDPSRGRGDTSLLAGSIHSFSYGRLVGQTDERKSLFFKADYRLGQYYNGSISNWYSSLRYRIAPKVNITMDYTYTGIIMPEPYTTTDFHLIGSQLDISFTTKLFFTTFVQYNTQADNINVNSRLQWRFKPASDLYLVYTDNYFPETLAAKSRAVVLKFNYWFNL